MVRARSLLPRSFFDLSLKPDQAIGRGRDRLLAARRGAFGLAEPVGERQPNRPADVAAVEAMLRGTGDLDFRADHPPTGLFSAPLRDATRTFQRRSGLAVDGIVNPDGETFQALTGELDLDGAADADSLPGVEDPDGTTQLGLRCRQIAVRLGNLALDLEDIDRTVEGRRQEFELALEGVRQAAAAKAGQPAEIAVAVTGIAASLATGNLLLAAAEAVALAARLTNTETSLNVESRSLSQAADALRDALEGRDAIASEAAELEAERDRLGCSSIGS